ncbi:MAG: glycerophosphodiester phosphodiesterase family protein [Gammaproteobacteria bacterium]
MSFEKPLAHRGLFSPQLPENSLAAFQAAIDEGYGIELDVMLTKDHQVIVFHDENLERLTGVNANVSDLTYDEIKALKLQSSDERIPSLIEVLELVAGSAYLMIEIKGKEGVIERKVYDIIKNYVGDFSVCSFNSNILKWFRDNACDILRGQTSSGIFHLLFGCPKSRPHYISYDIDRMPSKCLNRLIRLMDIPLIVWTVKNEKQLSFAKAYADNYIFEQY